MFVCPRVSACPRPALNRRHDLRTADGRRVPQGAQVVVLLGLLHLHLRRRHSDGADMESCDFSLLSAQAAGRVFAERQGAEAGSSAGRPEAAVRGQLRVRGQGLGRRADLWPDYHRQDHGECTTTPPSPRRAAPARCGNYLPTYI